MLSFTLALNPKFHRELAANNLFQGLLTFIWGLCKAPEALKDPLYQKKREKKKILHYILCCHWSGYMCCQAWTDFLKDRGELNYFVHQAIRTHLKM